MSDEQWQQAFAMANGGAAPSPVAPIHQAGFGRESPAPAMQQGTQVASADGLGMLDFNTADLGGSLGQFGDWLGKMFQAPPAPSVQMARATPPRVNFASVSQILQNRAKPGVRGGSRGV